MVTVCSTEQQKLKPSLSGFNAQKQSFTSGTSLHFGTNNRECRGAQKD